jgi:hypothetical protein
VDLGLLRAEVDSELLGERLHDLLAQLVDEPA